MIPGAGRLRLAAEEGAQAADRRAPCAIDALAQGGERIGGDEIPHERLELRVELVDQGLRLGAPLGAGVPERDFALVANEGPAAPEPDQDERALAAATDWLGGLGSAVLNWFGSMGSLSVRSWARLACLRNSRAKQVSMGADAWA